MIRTILLRLLGSCSPNGHWWADEIVNTSTEQRDHPGGPPGNDMLTIETTSRTRICRRCGATDRTYEEDRV